MKKLLLIPFSVLSFIIISSCSSDSGVTEPGNGSTPGQKNLTILYTNDEHGWMEPSDQFGGAPGMMGLWRDVEGYTEDGPFLILSGGDMWTGPALSTWFEGESMAEVMNAMNYSAAAIGNHEVDFGIDGLTARSNASSFPFLSANIVMAGTTNSPVWCQPYVVINVNEISVGIIGLTTMEMQDIVFPDLIANLEFQSYNVALERVVPQIRAEGAELLILLTHMGASEMRALSALANSYGVALIGGGHSHAKISETSNGVTLIEGGSKMRSYAKAEIQFNIETDRVISITSGYYDNTGGTPDAAIQSIVSTWQTAAEGTLSEVIGFVNNDIGQSSAEMFNLITDSWLHSIANADISISNRGGVRQSIPAGDITMATIMGVLPFENELVQIELTGYELSDLMDRIRNGAFVGGMTNFGWTLLPEDTPINDNDIYNIVTTDYYYSTVSEMQQYDPDPEYTYVNWRQPLIDYLKSLNTTATNPLDNYLDSVERQTPQLVFEY